jgi:cytochrome P450
MLYAKDYLARDAMSAQREDPLKPAWSRDLLDSPFPPELDAPYFDNTLDAWVLSRYEDILAVFWASELSPASFNSKNIPDSFNKDESFKMRTETLEALTSGRMRVWKEHLTKETSALMEGLNWQEPVDLLSQYAQPLCLSLAAMVTEISDYDAVRMCNRAAQVSAASAEPYNQTLRSEAKAASAELRSCFHAEPEALRESGFVALSQTMLHILANAWFALMQHPQQWLLLYRQPELIEQAIEELLRYAGLARILHRTATADVDINGCIIRRGERIFLRIIAANRDPERFFHPNEVDITRRGAGHLTLGAGLHSCVGASLVRMAAATLTSPLIKRFARVTLDQPATWQGGSGFCSPISLWVRVG